MNRRHFFATPAPWLLLLFAACFWLYTRHADFPFFYHIDESTKVAQLVSGQWNFHHPLLMLGTTEIAVRAFGIPRDEQKIAIVGRHVSAALAAAAVVAFALLAFQLRGLPGFAAVGILLGLHPQIFELAHFLKEDPALLAGLAASFCALPFFWKKPTVPRAALMGLACALSVSGKYIGIAALVPAILVIARAPGIAAKRGASAVAFASCFVLAVAVVNFPALQHLSTAATWLPSELSLLTEGNHNGTQKLPNLRYLEFFVSNTNFAVWFFAAVHLARYRQMGKRRTLIDGIMVAFPFLYLLLLSAFPKANERYFLAPGAFFVCFAGLGVLDAAEILHDRIHVSKNIAVSLCIAFAAAFQILNLAPRYEDFSRDSHRELIAWIRANIPSHAVIAQDGRVRLATEDLPARVKSQGALPQKVLHTNELLEAANLEELARRGATHVIISEASYRRAFHWRQVPHKDFAAAFFREREFYNELWTRGELLWSYPAGKVTWLNPGFQLYRLPAPAT